MSRQIVPRLLTASFLTASLGIAAGVAACDRSSAPAHLFVPGGDAARGLAAIQTFGCGVCHRIGEVPGADGIVGPSLDDFAGRTLLAGQFPNTPRYLVSFIMDPPAMVPHTGMPAIGVKEQEARDIATFLYGLDKVGPVHTPAAPAPRFNRAPQ